MVHNQKKNIRGYQNGDYLGTGQYGEKGGGGGKSTFIPTNRLSRKCFSHAERGGDTTSFEIVLRLPP